MAYDATRARVLSGDDIEIGESTIVELYLDSRARGYYQTISEDYIAFRLMVPLSSEGVEVMCSSTSRSSAKGRSWCRCRSRLTSSGSRGAPVGAGSTSAGSSRRSSIASRQATSL